MIEHLPPDVVLPSGWSTRVPTADDIDALVQLVHDDHLASRGSASVNAESIAGLVTGQASWTRRQVIVHDPEGRLAAWASVHDRAAGRSMIELTVSPTSPQQDEIAAALLAWIEHTAAQVASLRDLEATQLDAMVHAADTRLTGWLAQAGYERTRTWLQMSRPVSDADSLNPDRPGVRVRRVAVHEDGSPVAHDLQVVHQMLEESFADHFNSYRESFPEFVVRLREDPGHRWDHWWIAEIEDDGEYHPGGALTGSVLPPDDDGIEGSYVDYIGVHRDARGRGVAKALLRAIVRDAHARGRNRVNLEVDSDSSTGADALYLALGWVTKYRTESWHGEATIHSL